MDLHIIGAEPTPEERAAVDAVLGQPESGWDGGPRDAGRDGRVARGGLPAAQERRDLLLPGLHAVQDRIGWISRGALNYLCTRLLVPPAEAWGVVTFYHLFATEPRPPVVAHVCDDVACRARGARELCGALRATIGPPGTPVAGGRATWVTSPCLGLCERAPAALVLRAGNERQGHELAPVSSAAEVAEALLAPPTAAPLDVRTIAPQAGSPDLVLLARVGVADPESLDSYRAHGGYQALTKALELGPAGVIAEISASKLVGRGGAAFPTGRKWEAVAKQPARPHYLVMNADESEPGTFKDRVLLEEDPFALVEALTIAGYATGCEFGYVYLRGEYPKAEARFANAITQARAAGLLGANVAGAGFTFELEIRRGAGAYICGEETALFNSLEGKRGEPRSKPPFPVEVGLFGKPTLVNNVETLANVLPILTGGGAAWAAIGTGNSTGKKLFCLSGHVQRPGVYEVSFGKTLGELIELAGGLAPGRSLQAVLLGGAAGVFVGPDQLAMPLTFEGARAAQATLGSGVVLVYDDTADLPDALLRIAEFFRHESCGQCVPCRVGTVRQEELLRRLAENRLHGSLETEHALLADLGQAMRDASICGLGQTASSAIESALRVLAPFGGRP
ncbi:MAG: NAD(P)H-dependent oxidoreductase subunit E [Thermoanaerobaculia bacterium]|nr:NAD(P)H-dependent oxidoreductase subunit E [Thermoanaerobaculia bacterium]